MIRLVSKEELKEDMDAFQRDYGHRFVEPYTTLDHLFWFGVFLTCGITAGVVGYVIMQTWR